MKLQTKFTIGAAALPFAWGIYSVAAGQYAAALRALLALACILAFALLHNKRPVFSAKMYCAILGFVLLSVFAGKSLQFYTQVPYWDKLLHFLSGFLLYFVGAQICKKYSENESRKLQIWFAVLFAVAAAGAWEIYEFTVDRLLNLNAQNGSLSDTMTDMIAGSISALLPAAQNILFKK